MKSYPAGMGSAVTQCWGSADLREAPDLEVVGMMCWWEIRSHCMETSGSVVSWAEKAEHDSLGFSQKPGIWDFIWKLPSCNIGSSLKQSKAPRKLAVGLVLLL